MRPLLWLVFSLAVVANAMLSLTPWDGVTRTLASVGTGVVVLAAGTGLWVTRRREA
ncbi:MULTISPECIES: hypothetical protein [unclassified Streptomyces]|uniref:hypothetical protein n=1 Tax=unclassified Streptomyces TaxID=2593676 RepID=UPI000A9C854A|nr:MULTISPECIES: hypothetical protein [unclassified Streptomyces]